jgi:hypothetical protein
MLDIYIILGFIVFTIIMILALLYLGRNKSTFHVIVAILFAIGTVIGVWGWLAPATDPLKYTYLAIYAGSAIIAVPTILYKVLLH